MPAKPKAKRTPHLLSRSYRGEFVVMGRYARDWEIVYYSDFPSEDQARAVAIYESRKGFHDRAVFRRSGKEFVRVGPIYNASLKGDKRVREEE